MLQALFLAASIGNGDKGRIVEMQERAIFSGAERESEARKIAPAATAGRMIGQARKTEGRAFSFRDERKLARGARATKIANPTANTSDMLIPVCRRK